MKKICIGLSLLFCIILATAMPASAADYDSTIETSWLNSSNYSITPNTDYKLVYKIHANEQDLGGNYVFTVKLDHNNSSLTNSKTGFDITGYTTEDAYPEIIQNIELKNNGTELVYTLVEPTLIQIEVVVRANAKIVYLDEVVDISADLSRYEYQQNPGNPSETIQVLTQIADNSLIQANCVYPKMNITGNYELTNPTIMPVGAQEIDFNYIFYTDSTFNSLRTNGGLIMYNKGYTLDFSKVIITVNGDAKTYEDWLNESGGSPVIFKSSTGGSLGSDHKLTFTAPSTLTWGSRLPFKAVTNENFTSSPKIDFSGLTTYGEMQFNNRGGNAIISSDSSDLFKSTSSGSFSGVSAYNTSVALSRPIGNTSASVSYIAANSEDYQTNISHSHLLYQELFKSYITSTERDGTPNVTVTYDIPDGVTITHIRIPKSGANAETQYSKIILVKDGESYNLGNGGMFLDLVNTTMLDGKSLAAFTPGEDVVFEFEDLLKLKAQPGSAQSYSGSYSLSFIGTTNSSVTNGHSLVFKAYTNEAGNVPASLTTSASSNYYMTSYMISMSHLVGDENYTQVTTIEKEKPFYFYTGITTPTYPYYSAHRTDPSNPASTGVFSSPVFYFSLPEGVKITGNDAAEIVTKTGASRTLTDISGNEIKTNITAVYDNAGLYANGTLVEVKLEQRDNVTNPFWMRGETYVRLKVFIESEYDGAEIMTIRPNSILLSSWDPNAVNTSTGGSGGGLMAVPASGNSIIGTAGGTYPSYLTNKTLSVTSSESVRVAVSVMTPTGNLTYTPGDEQSYPKLKAGSLSETFKLYFSNDLEDGVFSDAEIFFILPQAINWKPDLNNPLKLTVSGLTNGDYTIYYTEDSIDYSNIGNTGYYNRSALQTFNWVPVTFTGNVADNTVDWTNVTAIYCKMDLSGSETLELQLPFELPKVNASNGIEYGATARGQTIYYLNDTLKHENTYTAAVMLVKSDLPVISAVNPFSQIPKAFQDVTLDYRNDTIPNWNEFYTYDDFTEVAVKEVQITFTPYVGTAESYTIDASDIGNVSYMPQRSNGGGGYEDDVDYVYGYKWTIANPTNYISSGIPGVYRITYITDEDGDSQIRTATQNITMSKNPNTIGISSVNTDILWKTDLGTTVDDYFKQYVAATDVDISPIDSSRVVLESSSPEFNISHPGNYSLKYAYTDNGNNTKNTTMTVSVRYNGTLNGTVLGNGYPVEDFQLDIDGTTVTTNETGQFNQAIEAVTASPTDAYYNITFVSVPAGLNYSGSTPISASGNLTVPAPTELIVFNAVSMGVNITGPTEGIKNIKLYTSGSDSPFLVEDDVNGDVVFEKEIDDGWFEAGDYYFTAELEPGYRLLTSDFDENSSILNLETAAFTLGNNDIEKELIVEKAPLISGHVWNDVNRDSIMDETETGISSATVNLLNDDFVIIESTATNEDGSYYFIGLDENLEYYIQVKIPGGYNRISDFKDDQKVNVSNNYSTEVVEFTSEFHQSDINAGFYRLNTGGSGSGNATVVDPVNPTTPMGGVEDDGNSGGSENVSGYELPEIIQKSGNRWILVVLLLVVIIAAGAVYYYKVKKNK